MNQADDFEKYWIWLASVEGMTPKYFYTLMGDCFSAQEIFEHPQSIEKRFPRFPKSLLGRIHRAANKRCISELFENMEREGIAAVPAFSNDFPYLLAPRCNYPPVLFYKGTLPLDWEHSVTMVGTRDATNNGLKNMEDFACELAQQDVLVVSGMAYGLDGAAHKGALKAGKRTVAVLGCGADVIYPRENTALYHEILNSGAVISQFPPGAKPKREHFPARNAVLAAITNALIVSEGKERSGAAITCNFAEKIGKPVFAIPGDIRFSTSKLPNTLIQSGACLVQNAEDFLLEMGWKCSAPHKQKDAKKQYKLDFLAQQLYNLLLKGDLSCETAAQALDIPIEKMYAMVTEMEMQGIIQTLPGNILSLK